MSFSNAIKMEILENKQIRTRYKLAQAYGLYLFGRLFSRDGMLLTSENREIAQLYGWFAAAIAGKGADVLLSEKKSAGKTMHTAVLEKAGDRDKLLTCFDHGGVVNTNHLKSREESGAFLAGAFLACGNMTDPKKRYHLEFVTRQEKLCKGLAGVLEENIPGVKTTFRRGLWVAYYKECSQIEDLLTLMGASRASLAVIDVEMIKEVRNRANRVTNCETANIDKMVSASSGQVSDIELIFTRKGRDFLPENLRSAAELRLANPEMSLRELADMMDEPITRSGMHHRLEKISRIAAEIRAANGKTQ